MPEESVMPVESAAPEGASAPAPEAASAPSEFQNIFEFDPFEPPEGASGATPPADGLGATPPSEPATPVEPAPVTPVAPAIPPEVASELEALRATVQRLEVQQQAPQAPAAPRGEAPKLPWEAVPGYDFSIPDGLMQLLESDDRPQRQQGYMALAKGVAQTVHQQVNEAMKASFERILPHVVQSQFQNLQTTQAIFSDFYGTYSDLNNPQLYPIVQQVAQQHFQRFPQDQWTERTKGKIAEQVYGLLKWQFPGAKGPVAPQAPAAAPYPTPPPNIGSGVRPGVPAMSTEQQEILDFLGG